MKKFFSLFMAFVFGATLVSAKTIYCKMEQDWWKADGAAVGCHTWGTGQGTDWPGVRMTPVEGQTDLWSIDVDLDQVQNVIFTRVNPDGDIADWGAKTKDLTIPTDDNNLFTITTSSAVWGDPGCDGEWSVYGDKPTPAEEGFGIIFSDGSTIKGTKNEAQIEYLEYMIEANLTANTTFQLYDFANKVAWTEGNIDEASTPFLTINGDNVYEVTADGKYTIYLKMYGPENNQVYCAYEAGSGLEKVNGKAQVGVRYSILGQKVDASYRGIVIMNGQTYLQ